MNNLFKFVVSVIIIFGFSSTAINAQSKSVKVGYYLTVAAYAKNKEHYAKAYTEEIRELGYEASYDFFPQKNYYFVYIKYYDDFNTSIRELYQTRKNPEFSDSWVYIVKRSEVIKKALNKEVSSLNDMFAERFATSKKEVEKSSSGNDSTNYIRSTTKEEQVTLTDQGEAVLPALIIEEPTNSTSISETLPTKNVFLSLFHGRTSKEVRGQIQVIDGSNHSLLNKYDGNRIISLPDPDNGNGELILISNVFGYKKVQHNFNYLNPIDEEEYPYVTNIGDTLIVNFELSRYTKGDIITMYNVFFFKDAAIMRPQSKFEINELVKMLQENPQMRIRIHGHTNGSAVGPIITINDNASNYFSLTSNDKNSIGSAKKLSAERA